MLKNTPAKPQKIKLLKNNATALIFYDTWATGSQKKANYAVKSPPN